jgi:hypothetical protein
VYRADRAATHRLNAPPPTEEDAEAPTTGPDSVVAVLAVEHEVVTTSAGLFDTDTAEPRNHPHGRPGFLDWDVQRDPASAALLRGIIEDGRR